jgi:hypothetical protein
MLLLAIHYTWVLVPLVLIGWEAWHTYLSRGRDTAEPEARRNFSVRLTTLKGKGDNQ